MADTKITALAAIATVDPAADVLPIVDISDTSMAASGTTKKVTSNQILGAGGTATLASATITGDLTVDTSTLKVDSTNNRVGIGTATPANACQIQGAGQATVTPTVTGDQSALSLIDSAGLNNSGGMLVLGASVVNGMIGQSAIKSLLSDGTQNGRSNLAFFTRGAVSDSTLAERYRIASDGVATWSNVGGTSGTAMTLNSTGLGVGGIVTGTGPTILVEGTAGTYAKFNSKVGAKTWSAGYRSGTLQYEIQEDATERFVIANGGNVGIGVTPSAWHSDYKALQIKGSSLSNNGGTADLWLAANVFVNSSVQVTYIVNAAATRYRQTAGTHIWETAVAGTGAIPFTQAMTLDASGNLLVGTTSALAAWATRLTLSTDAGTTKWAVGPYAAATNFIISADGGYGVYLNGTTATSWTGISDERLKDIIEPISNAVAKVGQLRSVIGKFKSDETNTRRSFLIAQDVQAVLPEAVDASNPDRLGVAYTEVIPLLVAAIKELTARVQTLEAR